MKSSTDCQAYEYDADKGKMSCRTRSHGGKTRVYDVLGIVVGGRSQIEKGSQDQ